MTADELWEQLDAFATKLEPDVAKAWLKAVEALRADVPQEVLDEVVRTGDLRPLLSRLDLANFRNAVRRALLMSADHTSLPFDVTFDALDPMAIRAIQASELLLVQGATEAVRAGILHYLTQGLTLGINPRQTAVSLRGIIGLTPKQAQSVLNYQQLLTGGAKGQPYREALRRATRDGRFDRAILRAIEEKVPLKPAQVAQQVARFEARALKRSAETIARTETMDALYRAHMLRWQQAIDAGQVEQDELRRFWHTAKDERTCPICAQIPILNPEGVAFDQPFELPEGETLMGPTAHPNCRCIVFTRIVYAKRVLVVDLRKMAGELSGLPAWAKRRSRV